MLTQDRIWAAWNGEVSTIEKALGYGASVEARGYHRQTRLDVLAKITSPIFKYNYENRPRSLDVLRRMNGTPLAYAAAAGNDNIVALLLFRGASTSSASVAMCSCELNFPPTQLDTTSFFPLHVGICKNTYIPTLLHKRQATNDHGDTTK